MGQPLSEAVNQLMIHPTKVSYCFSKHPLYGMAAWLDLLCSCGQSFASPPGADSFSLWIAFSLTPRLYSFLFSVFEKPKLACNPWAAEGKQPDRKNYRHAPPGAPAL